MTKSKENAKGLIWLYWFERYLVIPVLFNSQINTVLFCPYYLESPEKALFPTKVTFKRAPLNSPDLWQVSWEEPGGSSWKITLANGITYMNASTYISWPKYRGLSLIYQNWAPRSLISRYNLTSFYLEAVGPLFCILPSKNFGSLGFRV